MLCRLLRGNGAIASTCCANSFSSTSVAGSSKPKAVVFGGTGFIGGRICSRLVDCGVEVIGINRSGAPPPDPSEHWKSQVKWVAGDLLDPSPSWLDQLVDAKCVISTVGAFGNNQFMERVCGDANIAAVQYAHLKGAQRFVFISTHDYSACKMPSFVLRGYFNGKKRAEAAVKANFPSSGLILRPSFVYGKREIGQVKVPLNVIGAPQQLLLTKIPVLQQLQRIPIVGAVFVPWVSVDDLAQCAAIAAVSQFALSGIWDCNNIIEASNRGMQSDKIDFI